jgi:hypothetical protein
MERLWLVLQSRTNRAAVVTLLAVIADLFGVPFTAESQAELVDAIAKVVEVAGALATIYYRSFPRTPIPQAKPATLEVVKLLPLALVLASAMACAAGFARDGRVAGIVLGQGRLEACETPATPDAEERCTTMRGGTVSENARGLIGSLFGVLLGAAAP